MKGNFIFIPVLLLCSCGNRSDSSVSANSDSAPVSGESASAVLNDTSKTQDAPWHDTTFKMVDLQMTMKDKKIVRIDVGVKATIFLSEKSLRQNAAEEFADCARQEYADIIHLLDSLYKISDTLTLNRSIDHLDYLVSKQLQDGNAKVLYKKNGSFVPTISHRLEKYGMEAYRFFYLPDKRPFFSVREYSGILENNKFFSNPNELDDLYNKLKSIDAE